MHRILGRIGRSDFHKEGDTVPYCACLHICVKIHENLHWRVECWLAAKRLGQRIATRAYLIIPKVVPFFRCCLLFVDILGEWFFG